MSEQIQTITFDGTQYPLSDFSPQIAQAVAIYNTFAGELQKEQLAVLKTQSAIQHLSAQISEAVKKELAEKAAAEQAPVVEAEQG
jgi:hypothetical protein